MAHQTPPRDQPELTDTTAAATAGTADTAETAGTAGTAEAAEAAGTADTAGADEQRVGDEAPQATSNGAEPGRSRRVFRGSAAGASDRVGPRDPLTAARPPRAGTLPPARVVVHRPTREAGLPPTTPDRDYTAVAPLREPVEERPRRALLPVLIAAVVAIALVAVVVMALLNALSDGDADPSAAEPSATGSPSAGAPQTVPPSTPATASPAESGGAVGVGDTVPGLVAAATVVAGDLVEVTEEVSWPDGGPVEIRLQLPDLSAVSGLPPGLAPVISDLQVSVDGNPVEPVAGIVPNTWVVRPLDVGVPSTMSLRYLVDGVLIRSTPSQPGRALAVIAPLSQPELQGLPTVIKLAGPGVLNLACAGVVDATAALCAREEGDAWTAVPPDGSPAVVVAQLDLAPPA